MKYHALAILILGCLLLTAASTKMRRQGGGSNGGNSASLVSQLLTAATEVDRIKLLSQDSDFVFDFENPPVTTTTTSSTGGKIVVANRASFPALVGAGIAMAIGFIGPCGMNTPHTHPRATEVFFAVNGTFEVGFIQENGARFVNNTLNPGQATVFPMGSIHYQANLGCDPVLFVAGLSNEDPGTSQIAQNFFKIDPEILSATLGGEDIKTINQTISNIPANVALGLQSCQQTCGLSGGKHHGWHQGGNNGGN